MVTPEPWYLGQRAEWLAMLMFSRIPGAIIERPTFDFGFDLLVAVQSDPTRRFVVQVKGVRGFGSSRGIRLTENQAQSMGNAQCPVGLAVFDMSDDSGHFGWYLAPHFEAGGLSASLKLNENIIWEQINDEVLQRVGAQVSRWYDVRSGVR